MKNHEKTILLAGLLSVVLGACSANVPVRNSTLPQGSNFYGGFDQYRYGTDYNNRAPVLEPIAPISVKAGRIASIQMRATDPEGKPLQQYVLACAPELGGTQNSSTGVFQVRAPESLQTQDTLCGAMVIDSGALTARQGVTIQIQGRNGSLGGTLLNYAMPQITRALATVALPAFMRVFTPQKGGGSTGRTETEKLVAGSWNGGVGSSLDWKEVVQNAWSPSSTLDFGKTVGALGSLDVSSFWNSSSSWDSSMIEPSKLYSTDLDFSKILGNGASGGSNSDSGLTFEKFWNAESITSGVDGFFKYQPSADAQTWEWDAALKASLPSINKDSEK